MTIILNLLIAILGLIAGLTVNYAVDVFSEGTKFAKPFCWHCKEPQSIINYLFFPRKCESCGKKRRIRVVITDIAMILITLFLWNFPNYNVPFWLSYLFFIYAAFVLILDYETKEVALTISGVLLFGAIGVTYWGWKSALLGGLICGVVMLGLYYLGKLMVKIMIKRRGLDENTNLIALGLGDVYLAFLMGLALGFPTLILGLIITIMLGGAVSLLVIVINILKKKSSSFMAIAYGPYIIISTIFLLYFAHYFNS